MASKQIFTLQVPCLPTSDKHRQFKSEKQLDTWVKLHRKKCEFCKTANETLINRVVYTMNELDYIQASSSWTNEQYTKVVSKHTL